MLNIRLNVPLVGQERGYDGQPIMRSDHHGIVRPWGINACWYASACMVSYYFHPGPRLGLPTLWRADLGLNVRELGWLAWSEGLLRLVEPHEGFTPYFIAETLRIRGPIWAAISLPSVDHHAVVLTGVEGHTLYYNDPSEPARLQRDFFDFRFNVLFVKNPDWL
ncbi:papain-like cysteine protease family protein [Bradyrhizobium mercantei]|uniref:papain-like cysteine protease family protein n=1 Tax=Bradyrhizobium mercantei TaxID=1904807 RepID=UPI001177E3BB|nr:papain-like cysteine protease family protein [Bradyrhizobium mercantei]